MIADAMAKERLSATNCAQTPLSSGGRRGIFCSAAFFWEVGGSGVISLEEPAAHMPGCISTECLNRSLEVPIDHYRSGIDRGNELGQGRTVAMISCNQIRGLPCPLRDICRRTCASMRPTRRAELGKRSGLRSVLCFASVGHAVVCS